MLQSLLIILNSLTGHLFLTVSFFFLNEKVSIHHVLL